MRILHLSKFYPPDKGGLEQVVASLAEGAAAHRNDVRVVSAIGLSRLHAPGSRLSDPPRKGVVILRVPTHAIWWSQPIAPTYVKASRWPADVVHLHHPHPLADLAAMVAVRSPFVVTQHSDVRRQAIARPFYWPLVRAVLKRANAIVVPTRAHIAISEELKGFDGKIRVIPFGVDHKRFTPRFDEPRPSIFPASGPVGLFVGRLVSYKGLDILLEAVTGTDLRVVVVGEGPLRSWLEQEIGRRGLENQLLMAGDVAEDAIVLYFQSADYFVLPSTGTAEMFGIVLIEAMACAKPLITTALPTGVREVNQQNVTGLEVPPGDASALRAAMERLANDAALREQMGQAGRARVEERFTLTRMVNEHLALYEEVRKKA